MGETQRAAARIVRRCRSGMTTAEFLNDLIRRLPGVVPFDAGLVAVTDPATMLYTHAALLDESHTNQHPAFVANEYLEDDVMKYADLARGPRRIDWLTRATKGHLDKSPRFRDILAPMGLGEELRIAFVAGACWGVACMTREKGAPSFSDRDAKALGRLAPSIAEALRMSLLLAAAAQPRASTDGPGVLMLAEDLTLLAATALAQKWLEEITSEQESRQKALSAAVLQVVNLLRAQDARPNEQVSQPRLRVRSRTGSWLVLHASFLSGDPSTRTIAVVIERAQRPELAPLLLQAHGLTRKESQVAELVLRGHPTREISCRLFISEHTVQDHLKAVFSKVGVGSRRELVVRLLSDQDPEFAASLRAAGN